MTRTFQEECDYISQKTPYLYEIKQGFAPNMKVPGRFYVNDSLKDLIFDELKVSQGRKGEAQFGGFIPAVKQVANVAALPGIVGSSIALPDMHAGYGFAIGNVAAMDMNDPQAVVSPGGVGFDINCGVRVIRTNLKKEDVSVVQEQLAQELFNHIPVGVGAQGVIPTTQQGMKDAIQLGMDWSIREGYAWVEDKEHCEEYGRMPAADPRHVSQKAMKRGLTQMGTLGGGNHYAEIQYVDTIYDEYAAKQMGIEEEGQVVIMLHSGSRGMGHQVATDALQAMDESMVRQNIQVNDRQLACARIQSDEGQAYLAGMGCAANYAWVNRSSMTFLARQAFAKVFKQAPEDMDMQVIYDVSHNIAKVEDHFVNGAHKKLLVHRKGSTRAFAPHHPQIPAAYQNTGQPVLIGGTMGTCSYVLTGTETGMQETFGSTCHGAGRAMSRNACRKKLGYEQVLDKLKTKGISIRVASKQLVMEEAPESYKDVCQVVDTCQSAGISNNCFRLTPMAVVKG